MAACWSTPIVSGNGEVVATFALYYRRPGSAPPFHRRMVEACVPLVRVALQHEANRTEIERLAYFDPLTSLPNRRLFSDRAGVEALVRWNDPVLGCVPPDRFIALAEECGLIGAIDAWVRETACAQLVAWQRVAVPVPGMSVNVSPLRFHSDDVPAHVRRLLSLHELKPSALILEITERVMLSDDERTRVDLRALHEMGVRLSVDDFGTGYSSLGDLKRLPVSELKLDRRFVCDLEHEAGDRALADAAIGIGQALGLQVVAEGVETPGQRELLAPAGCTIAQGFLFTRALPAAELVDWLQRDRAGGSLRRLAAVPGARAA